MDDYKYRRILAGMKRRAMVFCRRVPRQCNILFRESLIRTTLWCGRRIVTAKILNRKRRILVKSEMLFGPMASEVRYNA